MPALSTSWYNEKSIPNMPGVSGRISHWDWIQEWLNILGGTQSPLDLAPWLRVNNMAARQVHWPCLSRFGCILRVIPQQETFFTWSRKQWHVTSWGTMAWLSQKCAVCPEWIPKENAHVLVSWYPFDWSSQMAMNDDPSKVTSSEYEGRCNTNRQG